jgi:hypothetical protein
MTYQATGWRYWGGFPRPGWQAAWKDYCSQACCDVEGQALDAEFPSRRSRRSP